MKSIDEFINKPSTNKAPMSVAEKQRILKAFEAGVPVPVLAKEMNRAQRTIRHYYQRLRGYPTRPYQIVQAQRAIRRRKAQIQELEKPKKLVNASRFYRSEFIPS